MLDTPYTMAQAIQLAVAPVFLLTAVAAMIAVVGARLGRVVDRGRQLQSSFSPHEFESDAVQRDLERLARRGRLAHSALMLLVLSALFVAAAIAAIFLGFFVRLNSASLVAGLFVGATGAFILALLTMLLELRLARQGLLITKRGRFTPGRRFEPRNS